MATERHFLSEIDEDIRIAFCSVCDTLVKIRPTHIKGRTSPGGKWRCSPAYIKRKSERDRPWKKFKKEVCEECGFFAKHPAQLHVDHIDGQKSNNDESNLMTLCANCHAYKTAMKADWIPKKFSQNTA